MNGFAGTRAEREWLATLRRIAEALEHIAAALDAPVEEPPEPNEEEAD